MPRLRFQAVHSLDVGDAYRRAVVSDARGPFNVAADPVIGSGRAGARCSRRAALQIPAAVLRAVAAATLRLRLQPSEPGWLDMALQVPLMDTDGRAGNWLAAAALRRRERLRELIDGIASRRRIRHPAAGARDKLARAACANC